MAYRPHLDATDYATYPSEDALLIRARYLAFHLERADSSPAVMAFFRAEMDALLDELLARILAA